MSVRCRRFSHSAAAVDVFESDALLNPSRCVNTSRVPTEQNEAAEGSDITGECLWLIPPTNPATTQVFHSSYDEELNTPNFFYQPDPDPISE